MFFYWIIFIIIIIIAISNPPKSKKSFWTIVLLLLFLGATRAKSVGTDLNGGYWDEFISMGRTSSSWGLVMKQFEIGFQWLMAKFKFNISSNPLFFFHILFAVTFSCFVFFIKKYSKYSSYSLVFLVAFAYYFELYNGMRQQFCFGLILLLFPLLTEKNKYLLFTVLLVVISFLFHKSQIVLLAAIPVFLTYKRISTIAMLMTLLISAIGSTVLSQFAFSVMGDFAFIFEGSNSNYGSYMVNTDQMGNYSTLSNLINTLFCAYVVYLNRDQKDFFCVLYVLGVVLLNVLTPISWIFQRIAFSFMFFRIIVYARLIFDIPNKKERFIYRIALLMFMVIMYRQRLINDNYQDVVPYVNALFNNLL